MGVAPSSPVSFAAVAKAEAKDFAPPPGSPGAEAQSEIVAQWWLPTSSSYYQPSTPPFWGCRAGDNRADRAAICLRRSPPPRPVQQPEAPQIQVMSNFTAGSIAFVESRLSREPGDIRELARNLSQEFASQAEDLKRSRPNDERLAQHDDLIAFFERMAAGLAQLADALDQAVKEGTGGSLDFVSLGKAAQIARALHQGVMQWIEQNFANYFRLCHENLFFSRWRYVLTFTWRGWCHCCWRAWIYCP